MSGESIAFLLDEGKAYWFKESNVLGLLPDGSLVREWRNIPVAHRDACIAALKARRKETSPKAQTVAYDGVYRIVRIDDVIANDANGRPHSVTIREVLAKGLATTLSDATLVPHRVGDELMIPGAGTTQAANPAHPSGTGAIQQPYRNVVLRWMNLDPNALDAINTARTDVTQTNLTVNGETVSGSWYNTSRKAGQVEDGSGFYEETWSLSGIAFEAAEAVGDRLEVANRYVQNVPKNLVKTTLDAEIAAIGATYKAAGYTYRQKIRWRDEMADIEISAEKVVAKSDSNTSETSDAATTVRDVYRDAASIPDADIAIQGVITTVRGDITSDGKFDYVKEAVTSVKQEIAVHTSIVAYDKTTTEKSGLNLRDADLVGYEPIVAAQGHVKRLEKRINSDGTYNEIVTDVTSISQTGSGTGYSDQHFDADDRTEDTERHTAATTPISDVAFASQGTIVETQNSPNEDGTYETVAKTVVSKEQKIAAATVTEEKFKQVVADIGKNIRDATLALDYPVTATTGEVVTRSLSENSDGTFDVQRQRDVAKTVANVEVVSEIQKFQTTARTLDRNNAVGDTPPVDQTAGTIVSVTNRINEYNRVDVSVETKTATAVADAAVDTTASAFEKSATDLDRNQTLAAAPETTQTPGYIKQVRSELNEFGRYDNRTELRTAVDVADATKESSATAFEVVATDLDRNQATEATAVTSQTAGQIKQVRAELNEFGKYDNRTELRTATEVADAGKTTNVASDSVATTDVSKNIAEPADLSATPVAGTINIQAKRLNDYGKWDVESTADVRKDQSIASGNVEVTPRYSSVISVIDGSSSVPSALGVGEYGRVTYRKDKYGRYVGEKAVTTYTDTITIPGWSLTSTMYTVSHIIRTTYQGIGYKRTISYNISVLQTNSASAAIAHIDGGLVSTEAGSSRYEPLANGQYRAIRIELDDDPAWESDVGGTFLA
jgi:hypothetical protein